MMSESDLERRTLESFLTDQGLEGEISRLSPVGGGCIGDAQKIKHSLGDYFVKSMPPGRGDVLEAEALGLAALAEPGVIPVPRVLGTGTFPGGGLFWFSIGLIIILGEKRIKGLLGATWPGSIASRMPTMAGHGTITSAAVPRSTRL
jgi:hypothetical protein